MYQKVALSPQLPLKTTITSSWSPPPASWVKINFDGATFKEKNLASLGGFIRNDKGLLMAASTQTITLPTSVEMVKWRTGPLVLRKN